MKNMSIKIYTQVPKEFEKKVKSGEIVRTGVTLRDANTGKIVGHLEVVEKSNTERGKQIIAQTAKVGIKVSGKVIKFTANTMGIAIILQASIIQCNQQSPISASAGIGNLVHIKAAASSIHFFCIIGASVIYSGYIILDSSCTNAANSTNPK